jgi:hypothetical protein
MLNENLDAGGAAVSVGYESASQFRREYSRLFGAPPHRDVTRMRLSPVARPADLRRTIARSTARYTIPTTIVRGAPRKPLNTNRIAERCDLKEGFA